MSHLAFYSFSLLLIMAATAVVVARNPVHSVLALIFGFFNTAGLFVLMGAEFIAMITIIVYVGAVAVLFLFVVMMMNMSESNLRPLFNKRYLKRAVQSMIYFLKYGGVFLTIYFLLTFITVGADMFKSHVFTTYPVDQWLTHYRQSDWLGFGFKSVHPLGIFVTGASLFLAWVWATKIVKKPFHTVNSSFIDSIVFLILAALVFTIYFAVIMMRWMPLGNARDFIAAPMPAADLMSNTQALGQVLYVDYSLGFYCIGVILLVGMIGAIVLTHRAAQKSRRQNIRKQISRQVKDTLELKHIPLGAGLS